MTREEAIAKFEKQLTSAMVVLDSGFGTRPGESDRLYRERKELAEIALSALRAQQEVESKLKVLESNAPLTLDELVEFGVRSENGENIIVYCTPLNDWAKVFKFGLLFFGTEDYRSWPEIEADYSKTWLAYRQKPEEG